MSEEKVKKKGKKLKIWLAIAFVLVLIGLVAFLLSGGNLAIIKSLFNGSTSKDEVQATLSKLGIRGYIVISVLSMLQVIFTFVPSEPTQVMAGVAFGFWKGGAACIFGVILGNIVIYVLYKIYGQKLTEYFATNVDFDFDMARTSTKITLIIMILYLLPAIPYGLICFFAASLNMKFPKYLILTTIGSIPSELTGVGLGHVAVASSWVVSLVVFLVLVVLLVLLFKYKAQVFKWVNDFMKKQEKKNTEVKEANTLLFNTLLFGTHLVFDGKIKAKLKNNVGRLEHPAIVLCNHGSAVDFVYVSRMLKKEKPHIVSARLYFYNKKLNKLLRSLGAIPKSMFASDLENAKSCMKVMGKDGVLLIMPEARLSTAGTFEGIQDSTYKFIQRFDAPVYTIRFNGDYLANPKWGNGPRKGSVLEGELNVLFEKGEAKKLSFEELKARIDGVLVYDEFDWLETQPQIHYKSKKLAEGLENIISRCPKCGGVYGFTTKKRTMTCAHCGMSVTLTDRYGFEKDEPFANIARWYEWQNEETRKEILASEEYVLESKVELRHSSIDGKHLTRHAGEGVCTLNRQGLTYRGTQDGAEIEKFFPMAQIYRLLFGAGEDFEIYEGKEIWYFVPEDKRSCVTWYVVSGILKEMDEAKQNQE